MPSARLASRGIRCGPLRAASHCWRKGHTEVPCHSVTDRHHGAGRSACSVWRAVSSMTPRDRDGPHPPPQAPTFKPYPMKTHLVLPFPVSYVGDCVRTAPYTHPDHARYGASARRAEADRRGAPRCASGNLPAACASGSTAGLPGGTHTTPTRRPARARRGHRATVRDTRAHAAGRCSRKHAVPPGAPGTHGPTVRRALGRSAPRTDGHSAAPGAEARVAGHAAGGRDGGLSPAPRPGPVTRFLSWGPRCARH